MKNLFYYYKRWLFVIIFVMTTGNLFADSSYEYEYRHVFPGSILNLGKLYKDKERCWMVNACSESWSLCYRSEITFHYSYVDVNGEKTLPDLIKVTEVDKKISRNYPPCVSSHIKFYKETYTYLVSGMVHSTENNIGFDNVFYVKQTGRSKYRTGYYKETDDPNICIFILGFWMSHGVNYHHYYYRIRVDDYRDSPYSIFLSSLPVGTSIDHPYLEGYLHSADKWYTPGEYARKPSTKNYDIPADVDVFKIELEPGVYCVETEAEDNSLGLEICAYKSMSFNNSSLIGFVNDFNRYNEDGQLDNIGQRTYFENDKQRTCYIEVKQRFGMAGFPDIKYKIRLFKARPVILVHGINASPKSSSDMETTFEDMRDKLGYLKEVVPCVCYDFPWYSKDPDSKGFEKYVGDDNGDEDSLFKFAFEKYDLHGDYKANIILHSMGGFIVRYQLHYSSFADMINQVLFIDSPQYGSDLANFLVARPEAVNIFNLAPPLDTSHQNYVHLSRGSDTIWKMHNEKDFNIPPTKIAFTIGTSRGPYKWLDFMFMYDYTKGRLSDAINKRRIVAIKTYLKDRYLMGLKRSDGIVPVTSQNLLNIKPDIPFKNYKFIEKHHTEVQKLDLDNMGSCIDLYNLITFRMNAL